MRKLLPALIVGCLVEWLSFAAPAVAQPEQTPAQTPAEGEPGKAEPGEAPDGAREEAREHFRRGVELYQEGAHRAALVEFERAYEVAPDYRLLYNIGQTKLQVQDYLGATQTFERYLEAGGGSIPPTRRDDVETALAALRERIARLVITANKTGADVFVDDVKVGVTPLSSMVMVNVGRHRVSAQASDGATGAVVVNVAGGDLQEVDLNLVAPKLKQTVVFSQGKERPPLPFMRKVAVGLWAAGGAALIGGGVTGYLALSASDDLDKTRKDVTATRAEINSDRSSAKTMALTTDVLVGAGVALVAGGTVCWILGAPKEKPKSTTDNKSASLKWGVGLGTLYARGQF